MMNNVQKTQNISISARVFLQITQKTGVFKQFALYLNGFKAQLISFDPLDHSRGS